MNKNNKQKDSDTKEYPKTMSMEQYSQQYNKHARAYILKYIKEKYKIQDKEANEIERRVHEKITLNMKEIYGFRQPNILNKLLEPEVGETVTYLSKMGYEHDYRDWWFIVMRIPYYQSFADTLGYKNGAWEFNEGLSDVGPEYTNELIYEFISLGGINDIDISGWLASDDSVLYIATMEQMIKGFSDINDFGEKIKKAYLDEIPNLKNRGGGQTTMRSLDIQKNIEWDKLPYNSNDIGSGSAMRSGSIGIFFLGSQNRDQLIALAVECSRVTHNSAIAILGSIVAALFTAYALEHVSIELWPHKILRLLKSDRIDKYMQKSRPNEYDLFARDKIIFIEQWEKYVTMRFNGFVPKTGLKHMKNPVTRYDYLSKNFSKGCDMPGACGDDSVIMAYDALLESRHVSEKLIVYSILHPGDSDTVGSIAFSWYGAYYHSPQNEYFLNKKFEQLEFIKRLHSMSINLQVKLIKIYFYDLYIHHCLKYIRSTIGD